MTLWIIGEIKPRMAASIFDDKSTQPDDQMLSEALGETFILWAEIKNHLNSEYGGLIEQWKFYNTKSGWILKTLSKKRNLFFFLPVKDGFSITFVFGDKAFAVIEKSDLPEDIINTLKNAEKYMEGKSLKINVKLPEDIENIKKLVEIKLMAS
jgi:Protein of unknown function (DUF3788)